MSKIPTFIYYSKFIYFNAAEKINIKPFYIIVFNFYTHYKLY